LGHIISEEGIAVDPERIRAIEGCLVPNNVSEVRYFMGLAGYYRRFIEGIFKYCTPNHIFAKEGCEI
jgi:hypothetical protein